MLAILVTSACVAASHAWSHNNLILSQTHNYTTLMETTLNSKRPRIADGSYQQFTDYGRQANCKEDTQFIEVRK